LNIPLYNDTNIGILTSDIQKASDNNAEALFNIAIAYENYDHHFELAFAWFYKAALQNKSQAQVKIGKIYASSYGTGRHRDYEKAAEWYQKAVDNGDKERMRCLGRLYDNGVGVPANANRATELFLLSVNQESGEDQFWLGQVYEDSYKRRNLQKAVNCYEKAIALGIEKAIQSLKVLNQMGYFPKDEKRGIIN
jgi:TPR repeat protein